MNSRRSKRETGVAVMAAPDLVTIRLLHQAGNWAKGEIVNLEEKRAEKLIRTGYAVRLESD